jgi:hypothetical protein
MKIAVQCASPLLQKSLEIFLKPYLCSLKQCDLVLRDRKVDDDEYHSVYISSQSDADIKKPFSASELKLALQKIMLSKPPKNDTFEAVRTESDNKDFEALEAQIDLLTQEYKQNIFKAFKAFYEQ